MGSKGGQTEKEIKKDKGEKSSEVERVIKGKTGHRTGRGETTNT
jgi:hypothetical protein